MEYVSKKYEIDKKSNLQVHWFLETEISLIDRMAFSCYMRNLLWLSLGLNPEPSAQDPMPLLTELRRPHNILELIFRTCSILCPKQFRFEREIQKWPNTRGCILF